MKNLLLTLGLFLIATTTKAQWTNTGNNHTTGQLSIGSSGTWAPITVTSISNANGNVGVSLAFDGTNHSEMGYRFKANGSNYYQVLYNGSSINWKHYEGGSYVSKMSLSNSGSLDLTGQIQVTRNSGSLLKLSNDANNYMYSGIDASGIYFEQVANSPGKSKIRFQTRNSNQGQYSQFFINGENNNFSFINGEVGIGTSSPSAELEIKSTTNNDAEIHINSSTDGKPSIIRFQDAGTSTWGLLSHYPNPNKLSIYNYHNSTNAMVFDINGNVGIGTNSPNSNFKLSVNGAIRSKEVKVEASWSDFVFYDDYKLRTLEEVEQHIEKNGHLPEIPSEAEVTENGINLGEMDAKLLQKIEELTLYLIEQNKENLEQRKLIEELQKEVSALKNE